MEFYVKYNKNIEGYKKYKGGIIFSVFYYPLGYLAIMRKSIKYLSWFSTASLIGLIGEMLLAYINK